MRLAVHDYGGHPFIAQLSRALAAQGREVYHLHSPSSGTVRADQLLEPDAALPGFRPVAVSLGDLVQKNSFVKRWRQEIAYGRLAAAEIARIRPDVVISSTTPIDAQAIIARRCRQLRIPFVYWLQDIYGIAMAEILGRKLGAPGRAIGAYYMGLENRLLRQSDAVVAIADAFLDTPAMSGVDRGRSFVIENWACLDHVTPQARVNPWTERHGLANRPCVLYSGTLGFKHNPGMLLDLARQLDGPSGAVVVAIAEGPGVAWLREEAAARGRSNLMLLPYQPMRDVPYALGSADVLVALLEQGAGAFSVPSKILTYLCAGRPVLASVPAENLAAHTITGADAGVVVPPGDADAMAAAARSLLADATVRERMGRSARRFAEDRFAIDTIAARFDAVFAAAAGSAKVP